MLEWSRPYAVREAYVYAYDEAVETWGTGVLLRNLISFKCTPIHDTDRLPVYGRDEKGLSVLRGGDIELELGGIQSDADAIMTGRTASLSGSGATEIRQRRVYSDRSLPYFALAVAYKIQGIGDAHAYFPNLMLPSLMAVEAAEAAKFVRPKVTAMMFGLTQDDGTKYDLYYDPEFAAQKALVTDWAAQLTANTIGSPTS